MAPFDFGGVVEALRIVLLSLRSERKKKERERNSNSNSNTICSYVWVVLSLIGHVSLCEYFVNN